VLRGLNEHILIGASCTGAELLEQPENKRGVYENALLLSEEDKYSQACKCVARIRGKVPLVCGWPDLALAWAGAPGRQAVHFLFRQCPALGLPQCRRLVRGMQARCLAEVL